MHLVITADDLHRAMRDSDASDGDMVGDLAEHIEHIRSSFQTVVQAGLREGVDWKGTRVASVSFAPPQGTPSRVDWIDVGFESAGRPFVVRLDDCVQLESRWKVADALLWKGPSEPGVR